MILVFLFIILLMMAYVLNHKDSPDECRYLELWWEYPIGRDGVTYYTWKFTNKPHPPYRGDGNMGLGYECYDLFKDEDIKALFNLVENKAARRTNNLPDEVFKIAEENNERFNKECEY